MKAFNTKFARFGLWTFLWFLLATPTVWADWEPHPAFGLGSASNFAVLGLGKPSADTDGQSKLDLSVVTVYGNVGVGPYGTLDFQGPSTINGDLYIDPTLLPQDILSDVGTVNGSRITDQDLSGAVADALSAAETNAALEPTQVFGRISMSMNIYGNGGLNVISIDGIDYARSSVVTPLELTLMGGTDDLFLLNVSGKFVLGPNSSIRGVDPSRVLINVQQGNTPVQFAANSYVGGALLSPYRKMGPLQGASGPIIGARVQEISLVGGAVLNPPPVSPLPVAVIVADQTVIIPTPVQLDGSASTAPSGGTLEYAWSLLDKPVGSTATLSDDTAVDPFFNADLIGDYVVQLVVFDVDGALYSDPAVATIVASEPGEGADLSLAIVDNPDPVVRKSTLTYTLNINNESPNTASGVILTAFLVGDVRGTPVAEPVDQCSCSDGEVTCLIGDLAAYEPATVQVRLLPKKAGVFSIDGTVRSAGEDPDLSDNTDVEQTQVLKY